MDIVLDIFKAIGAIVIIFVIAFAVMGWVEDNLL